MLTQKGARAMAKSKVERHHEAYLTALVRGLANIGSQIDWDRTTIDDLLKPIEEVMRGTGLPPVRGSVEGAEFWCAWQGTHIPWDPFAGRREDAQQQWRTEVIEGETEMGLDEWWADKIELARHEL